MNWEVWVMNSKTSLFDRVFSKALIKADIRNNWMWSAVFFVVLILNVMSLPKGYGYSYFRPQYIDFISFFGISFFFALLFGLFVGTRLFSYLNKPNSVSCMHGLPYSRRKLYFSRLASGFVLIATPVFVSTLVLSLNSLGNTYVTGSYIAAYMGVLLIYAFLSFAIACFAMTVCGNVVVSTLFSSAIAIMPAALLAFYFALCYNNIYGYTSDAWILEKIIEFLYVFPEALFPWRFAVYLGFMLVFLVAGFFVYKFRPLENCEEVVAFKKLHGLFIYAVGLVCGMISYLFFFGVMEIKNPVGMLPLGIIGVVVSTMIAKKSVNLRGTLKYVLVFVAAVLAVSALFAFDIFGIEKRVPKANEVEYVSVDPNYYSTYDNFVRLTEADYQIEDPEDIEKLRALHKAYISDKNFDRTIEKYHIEDSFTFTYHLKNGSTLEREYNFLSDENYEKYMIPVLNIDEIKANRYSLIDTTDKELLSVTVVDDRIKRHESYFGGQSDEAQAIFEAIIKDMERLPYEQLDSTSELYISVEYYVPGYYVSYPERKLTNDEKMEHRTRRSVYINQNFTETLKVLKMIGVPDVYEEDLEKISAVIVRYDSIGKESAVVYSEQIAKGYGEVTGLRVTDRETVAKIYDLCRLGIPTYHTVDESAEKIVGIEYIFVDEQDNYLWSKYFGYLPEELPDFLQR